MHQITKKGKLNRTLKNLQEHRVMFGLLSFFAAVGGFLFGYDTGVVSGAMLLLTKRFDLSILWQEIIVSATIAFAFLFALVGGFLNDVFGRKITTLIARIAQNVAMLVIGRSILGIGIGLASMTVPVYIAECAPTELRGRLVTINNLFITGGQFIASVMDGAFSYYDNGWRLMFGLAGVPSVIQFIGFLFLPESPRWLMKKKKEDKARSALIKIRGTTDVENELTSILHNPSVRRAVIVGCGLQFFQQFSGINTVMGVAGRENRKKKVNFRQSLSLIVLAVGFQLAAFNSPNITITEGQSSCLSYSSCEKCIEDSSCGFCYQSDSSQAVNGSCLKTLSQNTSQSVSGRCDSTHLSDHLVWAYDYCPTKYHGWASWD
ncbi:hypothetical protein KUTeg_014732 [Tegillarca granosa]|uniref:Major facilitator superfamily (MFS) profile domain-containing protein n=1 Tax=Tegillarca granosa TaxID=220873 RepID=A0ABQ9ER61_TEGGR|nr:hypothetical protein KUTeg_014732 [Tegillarca granosa]